VASFQQHVNTAVIATGVIVTPLHSAGLINITQSFILLAFGLLGGVLPDLDSDNSKPIQVVFKIFSIFSPLIVLLTVAKDFSLLNMIFVWFISSLLLHLVLFKLFLSLTRHRGVIHSIPMGVLFAQFTTVFFLFTLEFDIDFSYIAGLFLFFGFLTHLILDEIISLNSLGLRVKRSLGTALKLYDAENWRGSIVIYVLIGIFAYFIPFTSEPFINIFYILKDTKFY
jgi:hypothetical protein